MQETEIQKTCIAGTVKISSLNKSIDAIMDCLLAIESFMHL